MGGREAGREKERKREGKKREVCHLHVHCVHTDRTSDNYHSSWPNYMYTCIYMYMYI